MKRLLLLIGFSCTGKTSLGRAAFGEEVLDSDDELLEWINKEKTESFRHICEIYMKPGRDGAISLIEEAEKALIAKWVADPRKMIISLGPGFPIRDNWQQLRAISYVVLFRRSPQGIYDSLKDRREKIFECCPKARDHDYWDVGVIVDENKAELPKEQALNNIQQLLCEREAYYEHDAELVPDAARQKLRELKSALWSADPTRDAT